MILRYMEPMMYFLKAAEAALIGIKYSRYEFVFGFIRNKSETIKFHGDTL